MVKGRLKVACKTSMVTQMTQIMWIKKNLFDLLI